MQGSAPLKTSAGSDSHESIKPHRQIIDIIKVFVGNSVRLAMGYIQFHPIYCLLLFMYIAHD